MTESGQPVVLLDTHSHVLHSEVVGDDYQLSVLPPPSHDSSDASFPVLYVLDGPFSFGLAAHGSLIMMFDQVVPEMIVVGIGKPLSSMYEWGPTRGRDYATRPLPDDAAAGHADRFAECLRSEIIPFVESHYQADPTDRALWGQSLGGLFALDLLFHRPGIINRYLATSPAVANDTVRLLDSSRWPAVGASVSARLFTCVGSDDDEYRAGIEQFCAELIARDYADLAYEHVEYPGLRHIGPAPFGFLDGLRWLFAT